MLFLVTMFKWNQQLLEYYWRRRNMKREIITSVKKSETKAGSFFFFVVLEISCFKKWLAMAILFLSPDESSGAIRRHCRMPPLIPQGENWSLKVSFFFPSGVGPFLYLFDKLRSQKFCGTLLWLGKQVETSVSFKLSLLLRKNSIFGAISIQNLVLIPDLNDATSQMLSIVGKVRKPTLVSFLCGLKKVKYK